MKLQLRRHVAAVKRLFNSIQLIFLLCLAWKQRKFANVPLKRLNVLLQNIALLKVQKLFFILLNSGVVNA